MVNTIMAIIQDREQFGVRFGSQANLYQESLVQENYARDAIRNFGTDIRYYKLKTPYAEVFKPILDMNHLAMHAYGEGFVQEWEDPVHMVAYIKFDNDGLILNSYGIQPDSSLTMWVDQTDFAISMARKLSRWQEYKVVGNSEFRIDFNSVDDLMKNKDQIGMEFKTDLFNGSLQAMLSDHILDQILSHGSCSLESNGECDLKETPIVVPCRLIDHGNLKIDTGRINPLLYKGGHYDPFESKMVDCHLHLEIVSILVDRNWNIRLGARICGGVIYHDTEVIGKYLDKVGPEVGDLIDIPVPSDNGIQQTFNRKYEVVNIYQSKANEDYMNPFLRQYMYEMTLRAYVASGQTEPNGPDDGRVEVQDKLDLINSAAENAAKKVSLYTDHEDEVYGGYEKIQKRGNPSVQRDESNSKINDFNPPKKVNGLKKSAKSLFMFKELGMVLSLIDDPRNNNSYLKLSPIKKNTAKINQTYLEFLRANDDRLVLVNGIQSYLLADRFKMPEFNDDGNIVPIRLKHEVYAQRNGWADQPFHLVDRDDENEMDMCLQDLIGEKTTPENYKPISENRLTFPYTNTFLEVEYQKLDDGSDLWTCYVQFNGDETNTHFPLCSFHK